VKASNNLKGQQASTQVLGMASFQGGGLGAFGHLCDLPNVAAPDLCTHGIQLVACEWPPPVRGPIARSPEGRGHGMR